MSWPLSSAWFAPASNTGLCLVDLCQGVQAGGSPTCTPIIASCTSGSTSFTTSTSGPSFTCGYQSQNVTLTTGDPATIACGLSSFLGSDTISLSPGSLSITSNAGSTAISGFFPTNINSGVPIWPAQGLIVPQQNLNTITPFLVNPAKSSGIKSVNLPGLALAGGLFVPMLFFMVV